MKEETVEAGVTHISTRKKRGMGRMVLVLTGMLICLFLPACEQRKEPESTITVRDQLGRTVTVPRKVERILALHHVGGKLVFALGQQQKLVDRALYHKEGQAMAKVDPSFEKRPSIVSGHGYNMEQIIALAPDVALAYAAFDRKELEQMENAGIRVIGLKAESFPESFAAVRLGGRVLGCDDRAERYIADCEALIDMVKKRVASVRPDRRVRVMFSGPRSSYTVATGEMLTSEIITIAGGRNVAAGLKGFWADVSPEQVVAWNPDVIFVGSTLDTYGVRQVLENPQFRTVTAVKSGRVYPFPSNIGWWDFPAPHCVLGVVWAATKLYPDRFKDVDVTKVADEFYAKYMGHSFTEMGGKL